MNYKHSITAIATAVVVFNFSSCKEKQVVPPPPSNTDLLVGNWDVVKMGLEDLTDIDMEMEFQLDGDFGYDMSYTSYGYTYSYSYNGTWEWGDAEESVIVTVDNEDPYGFEISKLTETDLWLVSEDSETWELEKK